MSEFYFNLRDFSLLNSIEMKEIKEFIDKSDDTTIFHKIEWQEKLVKYFSKKIHVATLTRNDKIEGLVFFSLEKRRGFMNYYYSPPRESETPYGGLIISNTKDKNRITSEMIAGLRQLKNSYFNITFTPNNNKSELKLKNHSFVSGTTSIISTGYKKDVLWTNLKSNCRRHIRRAQKNKVVVESGGSEKLEAFYKILKENYSAKSLKINSFDFYKSVLNSFYPNKSRIYLAKHEREYVGGVFLLHDENTAYYWLGSNIKSHNRVSPGNIIQWEIIKYLSKNNIDRYDMVNLSIASIADYKRSFGGSDVKFKTLVFRTGLLSKLNKIKRGFLN